MRLLQEDSQKKIFINNIKLTNYRNFNSLNLDISSELTAFIGKNGIGKTNILEAISLLSPGKGLRNSKLEDIENINSPNYLKGWNISLKFNLDNISYNFSSFKNPNENSRKIFLNDNPLSKQQDLTKYANIIWLTPLLTGIFTGAKYDRRKFFDRIVFNLFPEHLQNLLKYEHYLRERINLFVNNCNSEQWFESIEFKLSELNSAIASSRVQTIKYLNSELANLTSSYPKAFLSFEGIFENMYLENCSANEIELKSQQKLKESRKEDRLKKQNSLGVHKTDFICDFLDKNMPAKFCSTGEQKSLILSIILAKAKLLQKYHNRAPILLLDEIVGHLDSDNSRLFLNDIKMLGFQAFVTDTNDQIIKDFCKIIKI